MSEEVVGAKDQLPEPTNIELSLHKSKRNKYVDICTVHKTQNLARQAR